MTTSIVPKPFVIASWNTLYEHFYKYVSAPAPFTRMPLAERTILFEQRMKSTMPMVDVFMLQECGSFQLSTLLEHQYTLLTGINGYLVTAVKTSLYTPLKTEVIKSCGRGNGKGFLVVILQTTDEHQHTFGVINTHLPFVRVSEASNAQLEDLKAINNYIAHNATIKQWFIGGDFNIPASKAPSIEAALSAQGVSPFKSLAYDLPTAFGHKGLEHIDYIFYTPDTITALDCSTLPSPEAAASTLLTQGLCNGVLTDIGRSHASDHAMTILKCFFKA